MTAAWGPGLIAVLVLIAGVALLFTARYPRGIFDLVLGLDRWVLRVAAYAGLMTDRYPPFRLDQGAADIATEPRLFEPAAVQEAAVAEAAPPARKWTAGRIIAIVAGSILALISLGLLAGGIRGDGRTTRRSGTRTASSCRPAKSSTRARSRSCRRPSMSALRCRSG